MSVSTLPISEQLDNAVENAIKTVSVANGCAYTLIVQRPLRPEPTPVDLLAVVYVDDDALQGEEDTPLGYATWRRPYVVLCYGVGSETNNTPYQKKLNIIRADVERAVMADVTQGGLAQNTFVQQPAILQSANEPPAVAVCFQIEYRTRYENPYAAS